MKQIILLISNTVTLVSVFVSNYIFGSGYDKKPTVGEVSDKYPVLITPADFTFSIWGVIYLLLLLFVVYQWYSFLKKRPADSLTLAGWWFSLTNVLNGLWIAAWINEQLLFSVIIMFGLLLTLIKLALNLRLETWDAPKRIIVFVWWPICIYLGWIVLAAVVNAAVVINYSGLLENVLGPIIWAVTMIIIACVIYLLMTFRRNMREAAVVGAWGFAGLYAAQRGENTVVAYAALAAAALLLGSAIFHGLRNSGYLAKAD